jgi:hypothetical protein
MSYTPSTYIKDSLDLPGHSASSYGKLPLPTNSMKKFSAELSGNALVGVGTGTPVGALNNQLGIGDLTTYQALQAKLGSSTNAYQEAFTAVKDGWASGGLGGVASAIFGGGATSLLGPIAGGIGSMVSGYMSMRNTEKDRKIAQQVADAKTLDSAKSSGGFLWTDPENKPDKYLDGTITKGNFFNPGGLLGKRTA